SLIAGLLAALRGPITKHVPVLSGLLAGLWDVWRNHTHAEHFGQGPLLGVVSGIPRVFFFALELMSELVLNIVDNQSPRPNGALPMFTPELALAGLGIYLGNDASK